MFISRQDVAVGLDCSLDTVDRLIASGQLDSVKDGRRRKIVRASYDAHVARLLEEGGPPLGNRH